MSHLRTALRPTAVASSSIASSSRAPAALPARDRSYATSSTSAPSSSTLPSGPLPLSWPTYLALRHKRRLYERAMTIPATVASLVVSAGYFGNLEADPTQTIMGFEPIFAYIGATMGCTGLGYLAGPTIGSVLFKTMNGKQRTAIDAMDKQFYEHIKARRVDPSYQSVNNPTPDYYGEKITSLSSYRRWLRDQAAYRRKALHGMQEAQE